MKCPSKIPILFFLVIFNISNAQKGKNGPLTVSSTIEVNEYTSLTANAISGGTSITVVNSSLNAHADSLLL